jgi:putative transposase
MTSGANRYPAKAEAGLDRGEGLGAISWRESPRSGASTANATVPQDAVAAIVRTIFAQPDHASAMTQLHEVVRMLGPKFPQVAELLEEAAEDVLAHLHFPMEHRRRLHSTNPLERLHKEIKRRTRVVGIFPTRDSLMRMVGTLLAEQDDEWQVSDRRYFSAGSMAKVDALEGGEDPKELLAQIA